MLSRGVVDKAAAVVLYICKRKQTSILEAFIVCRRYRPPEGFEPNLINPILQDDYGGFA